jgi:hypothetical protein
MINKTITEDTRHTWMAALAAEEEWVRREAEATSGLRESKSVPLFYPLHLVPPLSLSLSNVEGLLYAVR